MSYHISKWILFFLSSILISNKINFSRVFFSLLLLGELDSIKNKQFSFNCVFHWQGNEKNTKKMSNSRQFLVPSHYDTTKPVYPRDDIVRKRQYLIDELKSTKQYHQRIINVHSGDPNFENTFFADKLRQKVKSWELSFFFAFLLLITLFLSVFTHSPFLFASYKKIKMEYVINISS